MLRYLSKIVCLTTITAVLTLSNLKAQADLLVSSRFTNSIKAYDEQGQFIEDFVKPGEGGLVSPDGATLGPDGNLYVSNFGVGSILRYDGRTGEFLDVFVPEGTAGLSGPTGLAFGPDGDLYVNSLSGTFSFDGKTGALHKIFPSPAGDPSENLGLAFSQDHKILYIGSRNNNNVLRYNIKTGKLIDIFITTGSGGLEVPGGLAFGPDGNFYVASFNGNSILRYNGKTGKFIDVFVPAGSGGLINPIAIVFGPENTLYVNSYGSNAVLRYNSKTGEFIGAAVPANSGGLQAPPFGLVFSPYSLEEQR
jgi:DNA-binding beta-propeller fold protein YncE